MPSHDTWYRWKRERPEFADKIAHAREERSEAYADQMHALATRVVEEPELDPQRVNAAVNAIDKAARLQLPKTSRVEMTGKAGGAIEMAIDDQSAARAVALLLSRADETGA
jgi:hypothetical protein